MVDSSTKINYFFTDNKPYAIIKIKPEHIVSASKCVIRTTTEIYVENSNFFEFGNSLNELFDTNSGKAIRHTTSVVNVISAQFIPIQFLELLQFNFFFSHLKFLNIDGGKFFNICNSFYKSNKDNDYLFIDDSNYEYDAFKNKFDPLMNSISIIEIILLIKVIFFTLLNFFKPQVQEYLK